MTLHVDSTAMCLNRVMSTPRILHDDLQIIDIRRTGSFLTTGQRVTLHLGRCIHIKRDSGYGN